MTPVRIVYLQTKKSKKKAKAAVKETKAATGDGKEPEEGELYENLKIITVKSVIRCYFLICHVYS